MNRIKDLRTDADLKQSELAEIVGISQQTLSRYENETTIIDGEILKKIAEYFNVSMDYIMYKTNNPSNDSFTEDLTEEEIKELTHYKELLKIKRKVDNNKKISTSTNEK